MTYGSIERAIALYGLDYVTISCDRDGDAMIDTDATNAMFETVTAQINGYLVGKVVLPLTEVPLDLEKYAIDMVIYEMCPSASVLTEQKTKRYDAAISYLKAVRDNKIVLTTGGAEEPKAAAPNLTAGATIVTADTAISDLDPGSREYTRDQLKGLL